MIYSLGNLTFVDNKILIPKLSSLQAFALKGMKSSHFAGA